MQEERTDNQVPMKPPEAYRILQLSEAASVEEIEEAYIRRRPDFHPELFEDDAKWVNRLTEARDVATTHAEERSQEPIPLALQPQLVGSPTPVPARPQPVSRPTYSAVPPAPRPVVGPRPDQSQSRNLKIGLGAVAALILFVLVLAESGGSSGVTPESPQEKATTRVTERHAAEARIARLSFKCIEQPVCHADFPGNPLPLFIDGLDQPLVSYLQHHGYQEQWSDNAGFLHAGWNTGSESSYVALETERSQSGGSDAVAVGTGYIFEPLAEPAYGPGPEPNGVPKSGRWVVTWQLKDPSGRALTTLHYAVQMVASCGIAAESYCARVSRQRDERAERGTTAGAEGGYTRAVYKPPPLFPYRE